MYDAPYSASTLRRLNELNALLDELTDLVETNDISGFVARYQKANDLYASLSGKLPNALKKLYEALVRITELENMKDLCICLKKLSTATRGFGLYTITSDNGKLTLETLTRDGFGDPYNHGLRAFATNDEQGWMVIGTANPFMGTQLWRTTVNTPDPMERFTDLNPFNWAYPGIQYCVTHKLMGSTGGDKFAPTMTTTRAQIVQILYNLEGEPEVSGTTPFTDLTQDWYQDAVLWAYQTGVVAGTSATTFDPESPVTREQIAVILMGYADMVQHLKHTWTPADLSAFPDGGQVSDWARDAMADAVALGLISGAQTKDGTLLLPQNSATREQVATILMRFRELMKKPEGIISLGAKMGEGWLLTAEMIELVEGGYGNIVCAQPFGCLPNHIVGKGMVNKIRALYPSANITPIDYDPSATKVNQENRIKLMLAMAKEERHETARA